MLYFSNGDFPLYFCFHNYVGGFKDCSVFKASQRSCVPFSYVCIVTLFRLLHVFHMECVKSFVQTVINKYITFAFLKKKSLSPPPHPTPCFVHIQINYIYKLVVSFLKGKYE